MSVTIFPETDDIATVAAWQAMAALINRGADDPLTGFNDSHDSTRLQFQGFTSNTGTTTSDSDYVTVMSVEINIGESWYYEGWLTFNEVDSADKGDSLNIRVTAPSGCDLQGSTFQPVGENFPANLGGSYINLSGSSQHVQVYTALGGSEAVDVPVKIAFFAVGTSGSGSITIEIVKATDVHANDFLASTRYLLGRRIM